MGIFFAGQSRLVEAVKNLQNIQSANAVAAKNGTPVTVTARSESGSTWPRRCPALRSSGKPCAVAKAAGGREQP
jgi:hypothetical protein